MTATAEMTSRLMARLQNEEQRVIELDRDAAIAELAEHEENLSRIVPEHNAAIEKSRKTLEKVRADAASAVARAEASFQNANANKLAAVRPIERARDQLTFELEHQLRHPKIAAALAEVAEIHERNRHDEAAPGLFSWSVAAGHKLRALQFVAGDPTAAIDSILATKPVPDCE